MLDAVPKSLLFALLTPLPFALYVWLNDRKLTRQPPEATSLSPHRWTEKEIRECYASLENGPKSILQDKLPPKTGRRYIVTGGVCATAP
jgi:hypothetical protein